MQNRQLSLPRLMLGLCLLNLIAGGIIILETIADYGPGDLALGSNDASKRFSASIPTAATLPSEDSFHHLLQRNLFQMAGSQGEKVQKPQTPPPAIPDPQLSLLAVIMTSSEKFVLIRGTGSEPAKLKETENILGWTLAHIYSDHIEIEKDGRSLKFFLQDGPNKANSGTKHAGP